MGQFDYKNLLKSYHFVCSKLTAMDKLEFRTAFGKRVEMFRKKLNLSYRELAQKCDVDHSNISKIEKGEVDLRISTVQELAKGLDVHPQELFDFKLE